MSGDVHWHWLYAVAEAIPLPSVTVREQAQHDRTWAVRQIARVARQARMPKSKPD